MADSKDGFVHLGDAWYFCPHLREACDDCGTDYRLHNNWTKMEPWLQQCGWPKSEMDRLLHDGLDAMMRPAMDASGIATSPSSSQPPDESGSKFNCKAHAKSDCSSCFDFGPFLLHEARSWYQHLSYLQKARLPTPPFPVRPRNFRFGRLRARYPGFPAISTGSPPSARPHTLSFAYPNFRLVNQLPAWKGNPLGWVLFLTVVERRPGPSWSYTARDAAGTVILLQFVENWMLVEGGGVPSSEEAAYLKDLTPGTLVSLKCALAGQGPGGETQVVMESRDLPGVKVLKCSMADLTTTNNKLRQATAGCCAQCGQSSAPSSCQACKSPYCDQECQMKDWKEGKHKKTCGITAHLRSLNLMVAAPEARS